jgi:hypothetical protein
MYTTTWYPYKLSGAPQAQRKLRQVWNLWTENRYDCQNPLCKSKDSYQSSQALISEQHNKCLCQDLFFTNKIEDIVDAPYKEYKVNRNRLKASQHANSEYRERLAIGKVTQKKRKPSNMENHFESSRSNRKMQLVTTMQMMSHLLRKVERQPSRVLQFESDPVWRQKMTPRLMIIWAQ